MVQNETHHSNYREHLFDKRWLNKRADIINRDGCKCKLCGSEDHLEVHHKQYHMTPEGKKLLPWMYDDKYLITLCATCHQLGHSLYKVPVRIVNL